MGQDFWDRIISKLSALRVVPRECSCRLVVRSASEPDLLYLYSFRLDSMSSSSSSTLSSYSTSSSSTSISPPSQHRSVPIAAILAPVLGIGALLLILLYLWRRRNKHNGPVTSPERLAFSRDLRSSISGNKISVVPTLPSSDTSPILSHPIRGYLRRNECSPLHLRTRCSCEEDCRDFRGRDAETSRNFCKLCGPRAQVNPHQSMELVLEDLIASSVP